MKLFNKQAIALLACVITINALCVISVSYAFFTASVTNNTTEMVVKSGTMKITYTDGNVVNLTGAIPGDSIKKQFKIENTGTLATSYNIKLNIAKNEFVDKNDLKLTLKKKNAQSTFDDVFANKNIPTASGYIAVNRALAKGATDIYELTILFNKDATNQSDNAGKNLTLTVEVDSNQSAKSAIS